MTEGNAKALQIDLVDLLVDAHGYDVSVGLAKDAADPSSWGVVVTSRQPDIIMGNGGNVAAYEHKVITA